MKTNSKIIQKERGYILVGVMILIAVAAIVVANSLDLSAATNHTMAAGQDRSKNFFEVEQSFGSGVNWLRSNSTSLVDPFSRTNFYTLFDKTTPSIGSNDTSTFTVPTRIKRQGTSQSVILTNSTALATAWFPQTVNSQTGAAFTPLTAFTSAALGGKKVRVTLVDAIASDPTKDYGDTDSGNPTPGTDFQPIYRVDAMDALNQGSHLFGYVVGALQYDYGIGFYGRDYLEVRQPCDSYISNNGPWSAGSRRANCSTGSNSEVRIHQTTSVYGISRVNGTFNGSPPYGGKVCSDFTSGCPNAGSTCSGNTCNVPGLPSYSTWPTYCPTNQGSVTPTSGSTLTVAGNNANQKCWGTVTIGNNRVVTLTSTQFPYFIDTLDISNTGRINFAPSPATGTITLYVRNIVGDKFNGNQVFNVNNKPYQLRLHYLGSTALTLNGTAAMNAFIVAPYAGINVQGNFTYSGGIKATNLTFTGNGALHYDESGDITTLQDVTYKIRNETQRYR